MRVVCSNVNALGVMIMIPQTNAVDSRTREEHTIEGKTNNSYIKQCLGEDNQIKQRI